MEQSFWLTCNTEDRLKEILYARVNKYMDGKTSSSNKSFLKHFLAAYATDIIGDIRTTLADEFKVYDDKVRELDDLFEMRESYKHDINVLKEEVERLTNKRDELNQMFADLKARDAMAIYREVSAPQKGDTSYERQRRITSAGLMASSFLGLTSYNIANANGNSKAKETPGIRQSDYEDANAEDRPKKKKIVRDVFM